MDTSFDPRASELTEDNSRIQPNTQSVYNNTTVSVESSPTRESFSLSLASPNRSNGGLRQSVCVPSSVDWQDRFTGMKDWTTDTAKTTFQLLSETLGKAHKTQDPVLLKQIDSVREMKRQYERLLLQMRQLVANIGSVFKTERDMCALMQDLAQQSPDLQEDFNRTTNTLQRVSNNGDILLKAMNSILSSLETLCHKTIEDTLLTVKDYDGARLEFDASRADYERAQAAFRTGTAGAQVTLEKAEQKMTARRGRMDKLSQTLVAKIKLLEDNKVRVMQKQLLLFHNASAAYFSGDVGALETTLKEFGIRLPSSTVESKPQAI